MPQDIRSETERLYDEMCAKQFADILAKLPKPEAKHETCPYCGESWDKE